MRKNRNITSDIDNNPLAALSQADLQEALNMQADVEEQAKMPVSLQNIECDFDMLRRSIKTFQPEGTVFEVRTIPAQGGNNVRCCVLNTEEGLNAFFGEIQSKCLKQTPLYMTLQAVRQDAKCLYNYGKIVPNNGCVKDADISHYQWVYVDVDPEHPAGTQATDTETAYAKEIAEQVKKYLGEQGFPNPIYSFTGNGYSLNYPTELPNTKENAKLVNSFLKALKVGFSTEHAQIDTTTGNPARITKVIGCPSCKGENTPEHPHRKTYLIDTPERTGSVTAEQLQAVIEALAPKKEPKKSKKEQKAEKQKKTAKIADVEQWLESYDISYRTSDMPDDESGLKYELEFCPFNEHPNCFCSAIFRNDDGTTTFSCFHDHCKNYTIHDVLEKYPLKNQIPLFNSDDITDKVFNAIVTKCSFIVSQNKEKFLLTEQDRLLAYGSEDAEYYILTQGQNLGKMLTKNNITTICMNLAPLFGIYGRHATVAERAAFKDNTLYYSLDEDKVLVITADRVMITEKPGNDVYFYHSNGFLPQCEPDLTTPASELPALIEQLFNVNSEQMLLFLAVLVCMYFPNVNTPILVLSGGQGSSKSTSCKKLKALIDPAVVDVQSLPDKEDSLYTALSANYLCIFDNIQTINSTYSDLLCMAVTGAYATKRKLYSNNSPAHIQLQSKLVLNGIGTVIGKKPDLAERCATVYLDPITSSQRRTDAAISQEFNELKPKVMGAIANAVSDGLKYLPQIKKSVVNLPRLADFTIYGASCIKAMGLDWEKFVQDYQQATVTLIGEQMEQNELVMLLKAFLKRQKNKSWAGQPQQFYEKLSAMPNAKHIMDEYSVSTLSKILGQMQVSLQAAGINFDRERKGKRTITISMDDETEIDDSGSKSEILAAKGMEIDFDDLSEDGELW